MVWRATRFPVGIALATSNLGRLATRQGHFDLAAQQLAEAREAFRAIGAESFVLETDARECERRVAAGEGASALELIEQTAARAERLGGTPALLTFLDRLAGYALAKAGEGDDAMARMEAALARKSDYDIALATDGLRRLGARDTPPSDEVLSRLGVVAVPEFPVAMRGR